MTRNPLLNALIALGYIVLVASFMFFAGHVVKIDENTVLAPITFISLFSFSAAVMGYLFLYQPFVLYFSDHKSQAINLFVRTLLSFGGITFILLMILFLRASL